MPPRTPSGKTFEVMLAAALKQNGYTFYEQATSHNSLGGRKHKVDFTITDPVAVFVSLKWQDSAGTVEEKVPFETLRLIHLLTQPTQTLQPEGARKKKLADVVLNAQRAYIVLAGGGWTPKLKSWYTSGQMQRYINHLPQIQILDFYDFMKLVNNKKV